MASFIVHEHHSKKLHYDFRLEIGGVLKSWAIPKGPSMSPRDKRLAVMVEDHPVEYGSFEGIIPEGNYGAGAVLVWDSGTFEASNADFEKGKVEFSLQGRKLKGFFVLTRLKGKEKEWLLIKKNDGYALPSFSMVPELTADKLAQLNIKAPPCRVD